MIAQIQIKIMLCLLSIRDRLGRRAIYCWLWLHKPVVGRFPYASYVAYPRERIGRFPSGFR